MSVKSELKSATRQCAFINRLVKEAEACTDSDRAGLLYGMAKVESGNLSKSLRTLLARKRPAHQLNQARAA
ncbi:MAG: hypothetical protein CMM10_05485 [Rhodospirillaceae bacterium]|jgi:hypothetical protein|nr:hypothetical protein [Rhodospirillaceae bacterium]|tara:strand:+ start:1403 stop:1615 length:213 start_codon:yes stop_codon:yes gene_type:complete